MTKKVRTNYDDVGGMFRTLFLLSVLLLAGNCDSRRPGGAGSGPMSADSTAQANNPYSIQVAAFSDQDNALSLVERLRTSGLSAFIVAPDSSQHLFRTQVGPFATREEATKALDPVKNMGFRQAFIRLDSAVVAMNQAKMKEDRKADEREKVKDLYLALKDGNPEVMPEVSAKSELFTKQITWDGQCSRPRWSPSGREIAFYKEEGGVTGIYTIGSGGGPVSRVIESSESLEVLPEFEWDPQGSDLAFTANIIDENWERLLTLNVVDKSGLHVTRILNQRNVPFGINSIRWSPNSYMLAFNLDYGKVDPELERIQRVLLANLNKLEETYPDRNRTIHGSHIATTSVLEQTNWVAGWASSTKLIFLASNADTRMQPDQEGYEIWQFDALTERRKLLREGKQVKPFRSVALLGGQDRLIYSGRSGKYVTSLDYFTGKEVRLLNSPKVSSLSPVYVNEYNQVLFVLDDQLWVNNLKGETLRVTQLGEHVVDFTLSPLSERICFVRNGSLFVSRVESSTATTAH